MLVEGRNKKIVSYPLRLDSAGHFLTVDRDGGYPSQLRFFLDFPRGHRLADFGYGSDLGDLEQQTGVDLDAMVPVHLMVLQMGISAYIAGITLEAISFTRSTMRERKGTIDIVFQRHSTRSVEKATYETNVLWQS